MWFDRFFPHAQPQQAEANEQVVAQEASLPATKAINEEPHSVAEGMLCPMPGCYKRDQDNFGAYSDFDRESNSTGI